MDAIDFRIIRLLEENGRVSFAALGEAVGLSPHGAADRVRRLERSGTIVGFTVVVNPAALGRGLEALIDVRLHPQAAPETLERYLTALPVVREVIFLTGRFDYQVRVACTGPTDLDRTVRAIRRQSGAFHTDTRIVMRVSGPASSLTAA